MKLNKSRFFIIILLVSLVISVIQMQTSITVFAQDTLEYINDTFILDEPIKLENNSALVVRNATLFFTSSSRTIIDSYDNTTLIFEDAQIMHRSGYSYIYLRDNTTGVFQDSNLINVYTYLYGYNSNTIFDWR